MFVFAAKKLVSEFSFLSYTYIFHIPTYFDVSEPPDFLTFEKMFVYFKIDNIGIIMDIT